MESSAFPLCSISESLPACEAWSCSGLPRRLSVTILLPDWMSCLAQAERSGASRRVAVGFVLLGLGRAGDFGGLTGAASQLRLRRDSESAS